MRHRSVSSAAHCWCSVLYYIYTCLRCWVKLYVPGATSYTYSLSLLISVCNHVPLTVYIPIFNRIYWVCYIYPAAQVYLLQRGGRAIQILAIYAFWRFRLNAIAVWPIFCGQKKKNVWSEFHILFQINFETGCLIQFFWKFRWNFYEHGFFVVQQTNVLLFADIFIIISIIPIIFLVTKIALHAVLMHKIAKYP